MKERKLLVWFAVVATIAGVLTIILYSLFSAQLSPYISFMLLLSIALFVVATVFLILSFKEKPAKGVNLAFLSGNGQQKLFQKEIR